MIRMQSRSSREMMAGRSMQSSPYLRLLATETSLERLLADLDKFSWNDPDGRRIYYERWPAGSGVAGGMGGAQSTGELWLHPDLEKLRLRPNVLAVLAGERATLR